MRKQILNFLAFLLVGLLLINCANRGTPSGGERDRVPPEITRTTPDNYSVDFDANEIRIYFDEYIKIKNLQKNLIVSPPMNPQPDITPLGSASKYITIKIYDTLSPNTTYALNFGESIVDNNEENPYPFYRYVFSTGSYIDSLSISGSVRDALSRTPDEFVTVMLYEMDSTFTDSIIYQQKPNYVTNTLDSTSTFTIQNVKEGQYLMIALKDENDDYLFQQKVDKIGFVSEVVTLPTDSSYTIELFNENIDYKALQPRQISGQKIAFGFEGDPKEMAIKMLSTMPEDFESRITKDPKKDSLYYYFSPKLEMDSLNFVVQHPKSIDSFTVRYRDQLKDTLEISNVQTGVLGFDQEYEIEGNIPFVALNRDFISLIDKDSVAVEYQTRLDSLNNRYVFDFKKEEENTYRIQLLPGAITDFFGNVNDTLNYSIKTRTFDDYGNLQLSIQNAVYPIIVQMINSQEEVVQEKYLSKEEGYIQFRNINPAKYFIRVINDTNGNGLYDPGNYLTKQQSERVSYYPNELDIRASWYYTEQFIMKQ